MSPPIVLPSIDAAADQVAHVIATDDEDRHAPHQPDELVAVVIQQPLVNQTIDSAGNIQGGVIPPPDIKIGHRDPITGKFEPGRKKIKFELTK